MAELRADRLQTARVFAQTYRVITVLKGAGTIIAAPSGETRVNTTGNPGIDVYKRQEHHHEKVRCTAACHLPGKMARSGAPYFFMMVFLSLIHIYAGVSRCVHTRFTARRCDNCARTL